MAVSPDFLLKTPSVDARPKAAAKEPEAAREARGGAGSSFSDVYAKERQAKPAERPTRGDAGRERPVDDRTKRDTAQAANDEKPAVAESGNALPPEELSDEAAQGELDPLLLLGLGGQFAPLEDPQADQPQGEMLLTGLPGSPGAMAAVQDSAADETLAALQAATDPQLAMQKTAQDTKASLSAGQLEGEPDDGFASALLASSESSEEGLEAELNVDGLLEGVDGAKESRSVAADESLAARLNPLSQAIAQQVQQPQRPALVPGQPVQMQQAGWSEAVVDRVMWLSSQNLKSAEIQLDPAELGRMEVRIDMTKDQAQVTFLSPHAGVRDALEGQMVRLREMFSQQGMNLVDVNVSDQSLARGWQGGSDGESSRRGFSGETAAGDEELQHGVAEIAGNRVAGDRGLVDYYA
ncbi:flagellar hook-length control protein FliK [Pseudomonas lopnurensis]|uniref:flagellar hook-length control protein FliK n=1 Tax=Pseudomonas lopnurensis TaxID=1477517 RepID=UPI00187A23AB|nr:flagellar hook-length control protein FliK [Pseudomonas lopnurensis]MBE7373160.1 flagellar hook-length control protein FliK [Pseudomonas lopnurensis]